MSNFILGAIYATYLSPTYINILTIYAIANIHDVSWGSRPTEHNALLQAVERRKTSMYKNFRANFLIFWLIINVAVGAAIVYLAREGDVDIIFYLGAFLLLVMLFKIIFATMFYCKAKIDDWRVHRLVKKRKSGVFDDVVEYHERNKENVFEVYYDPDGNIQRANTKDDKEYKEAEFHTSINSQKTFRGFNLKKLTEQHKIQQGIVNNFLGRLGTRTFYKEDEDNKNMKALEEHQIIEKSDDDDDDSSLLNSPDPNMNTKINNLFRKTMAQSEAKVKFEDVIDQVKKDKQEMSASRNNSKVVKSSIFPGLKAKEEKKAAPPPASPSKSREEIESAFSSDSSVESPSKDRGSSRGSTSIRESSGLERESSSYSGTQNYTLNYDKKLLFFLTKISLVNLT